MTVRDRAYTAVAILALAAAAYFAVLPGESDEGVRIPALTIETPAEGSTVRRPVDVTFRSSAELRPGDMGWATASRLHLHVYLDETEVMPAANEVRALDADRYVVTLSGAAPGTHRVRLGWSDAAHRPIAEGETAPRSFTVAP